MIYGYPFSPFSLSLDKLDDDDNLPFMEALEISKNYNVHQSISDHFGGKEDEDIPDKVECEEPNLIEANPVSYYW